MSRFDDLRRLVEWSDPQQGPRPAHVTPGDPIVVPGVGRGRVVDTVDDTAWIHLLDDGGDGHWMSAGVEIKRLDWRQSAWHCDVDDLGAAGDGPGASRYPL